MVKKKVIPKLKKGTKVLFVDLFDDGETLPRRVKGFVENVRVDNMGDVWYLLSWEDGIKREWSEMEVASAYDSGWLKIQKRRKRGNI